MAEAAQSSRVGAALATDTDGGSAELAITRDIVQRKRAQRAAGSKVQPWKNTYIVAPEDLPRSHDLLHDTPWFDDPNQYPASDSAGGS
jgi:hypothetical protein